MLGSIELVGVHAERDARRGVAELARDEHDAAALSDEQAREGVAQIVETKLRPVAAVQASPLPDPAKDLLAEILRAGGLAPGRRPPPSGDGADAPGGARVGGGAG